MNNEGRNHSSRTWRLLSLPLSTTKLGTPRTACALSLLTALAASLVFLVPELRTGETGDVALANKARPHVDLHETSREDGRISAANTRGALQNYREL